VLLLLFNSLIVTLKLTTLKEFYLIVVLCSIIVVEIFTF